MVRPQTRQSTIPLGARTTTNPVAPVPAPTDLTGVVPPAKAPRPTPAPQPIRQAPRPQPIRPAPGRGGKLQPAPIPGQPVPLPAPPKPKPSGPVVGGPGKPVGDIERPTPMPYPSPNGVRYNAITGRNGATGSGSGFNPLSAGRKRYGAGRTAPNIGKTPNKAGYGARDLRRKAQQNALNKYLGGQ